MKDREFLIWLHERLHDVHGEDELFYYMHRLRTIIASMPPNRYSPNTEVYNSLKELQQSLVAGTIEEYSKERQ